MTLLETALCTIKDELMESGYFNRFYEYSELLDRADQKYPQVYTGKGQYKQIYDFDVNGSGYIRKKGEVRFRKLEDHQSCTALNPILEVEFPLRLVAGVPKSMTGDNGFSDDLLAMDLITYIGMKQPGITQVQSVMGSVSGYTTDRNVIWSDEVQNIDKQLDLSMSFIAIDFTLTFVASLECIKTNCTY